MAQIRNRFDIQNSINENSKASKRLPSFFDTNDEVSVASGMSLSVLIHIALALIFMIISVISGLIFPHLPKPALPNRDVEFQLVQNNSKPPINKQTKIKSDKNSQAGGKHDPKKPISEPSPNPSPIKKATPAQPKAASKPLNPIQKLVQKPTANNTATSQPKTVSKPTVAKPSPIKAPVANKPVAKPTAPSNTPSAPKLVAAPKSPFTIGVPKTSAPVGTTYRPQGSMAGTGTSKGNSAPAPKFSSSTGTSTGSGGTGTKGTGTAGAAGSYASRGGGYGNAGNPSPGNPYGKPGVDASKEVMWGPYMRDLQERIKRNWVPPKGDSSKRIIITFTISRDGRLLSKSLTKSSGVPLADTAAMKAIELTAPFRPLPPEFKGSSVPIEFTFDYNVLNSVLK